MDYNTHDFKAGDILKADQLNDMDNAIKDLAEGGQSEENPIYGDLELIAEHEGDLGTVKYYKRGNLKDGKGIFHVSMEWMDEEAKNVTMCAIDWNSPIVSDNELPVYTASVGRDSGNFVFFAKFQLVGENVILRFDTTSSVDINIARIECDIIGKLAD